METTGSKRGNGGEGGETVRVGGKKREWEGDGEEWGRGQKSAPPRTMAGKRDGRRGVISAPLLVRS